MRCFSLALSLQCHAKVILVVINNPNRRPILQEVEFTSSLREGVAVPEGWDGGGVYSDILKQHSFGFSSGFEILNFTIFGQGLVYNSIFLGVKILVDIF